MERPEEFLASLERMVADLGADKVASERRQTRFLRGVLEEEATFVGLALDLAEGGDVVIARTSSGRPHRGVVVAVGRDFLALGDAGRPPALLALAAVSSLRPVRARATRPAAAGSRAAPLAISLTGLLERLAPDRPRVQVTAAGDSEALAGELVAMGRDIITLRLDGGGRLSAYFRAAAVVEVVLLDH